MKEMEDLTSSSFEGVTDVVQAQKRLEDLVTSSK
jgi:hypothetical protein